MQRGNTLQQSSPRLSSYILVHLANTVKYTESRGRVVTCWPGSQEVGGSIPGCATKFVRCKNLAFTLESVSPVARIPRKAVGPMYIRRVIPEHVKDPRAPVDKSRVLLPGVTGQIPELLRIAVKLHRHHYR